MLGSLSPRRYLWGNQSSGGAVKAADDDFTANEVFSFGISRSFKHVLVYVTASSLAASSRRSFLLVFPYQCSISKD